VRAAGEVGGLAECLGITSNKGALKRLPVQSPMCLKCHVLACKNPLRCAWTYALNFHADVSIYLEIRLLIHHSSICMNKVKEGTKPMHG